jgi:hypothetical protein
MLDTPIWDAEKIETLLAALAPKTAERPTPSRPTARAAGDKTPPPAPPRPTPARADPLLPPWPHLALEPQPGDPPDDLTRLGRGFAAPKLTPETFPDPPPDPLRGPVGWAACSPPS